MEGSTFNLEHTETTFSTGIHKPTIHRPAMNENQQKIKYPNKALKNLRLIGQYNRDYEISKIKMTKRGNRKHKHRPLVKKSRQIWNPAEVLKMKTMVNVNDNTRSYTEDQTH